MWVYRWLKKQLKNIWKRVKAIALKSSTQYVIFCTVNAVFNRALFIYLFFNSHLMFIFHTFTDTIFYPYFLRLLVRDEMIKRENDWLGFLVVFVHFRENSSFLQHFLISSMLTIGIFPPRRVFRCFFFHIKNFSQKWNFPTLLRWWWWFLDETVLEFRVNSRVIFL